MYLVSVVKDMLVARAGCSTAVLTMVSMVAPVVPAMVPTVVLAVLTVMADVVARGTR